MTSENAAADDPRIPPGGDRPSPPKPVMLPTLETPTLTKAELAELLFERLGLNKRESKDMVEAFFDLIHADRKSTRLNSSHIQKSRMPSSA